MGNHSSCFFRPSNGSQTAKIFDAQGNLRRVELPVKAAELMLEEPSHVIAPVEELRRTRRVSAMRADDELLAGKVYFLVPVSRVHCKVSELEMAIIELVCDKRACMRASGSKVLPAMAVKMEEGEDKVLVGKVTGLAGHQLGSYRRWCPVLEPISEAF